MTASEFAFLALGLVLGVASGAALIEVLRARPPAPREVRVTVAPNAIHSRMSSTLADPSASRDAIGPAARGPGDRRWRDESVMSGEPAATGRRSDDRGEDMGPGGTPVRSESAPIPSPAAAQPPSETAAPARPAPLWLSPSGEARPAMVAVPMSLEPDPITTALRASAAAGAVAAMAGSAAFGWPSHSPSRSESAPLGAMDSATAASAPGASTPGVAAPGGSDDGPPSDDGPCAETRRVADERCAVEIRARAGASAAGDALRAAQRTYDEHVARAEAAATRADPRAVRTAKEQAQRRFHDARNGAQTRDDVEAGARVWLAEINRINHETREAVLVAELDRSAATALAPDLERLAVEADAARISAERADETCIAAREAVATCDEARLLDAAAARVAAAGEVGEGHQTSDEGPGRIAAATEEPDEEFAFSTSMASRAGQDAPILRILRGDREAMLQAVARLGGDDPEARRRWQARLSGLTEALIARSIEASAFDFPLEHPFWGPFDQSQNRDIAAGLSSLGFRFDGFGGWVDERVPTQRDLSMAVGYAGLDPMRIRPWPNEAETRDLLRDVRVAADEYIAGAAGGLTLGELLTLLGRRADGLTELWNEWGTVRPILLEAG